MNKTHTSHIIYQVLAGAAALLLNLLFPDFIHEVRFWVLAIVIIVIGMPHGALDHVIAFKAFRRAKNTRNQLIFYISYLSIMAIYGVLWFLSPLTGLILFLLMTLYHFGQADAERFSLEGFAKHILLYSRGLTIVGLILFGSDPFYSSVVIEEVTGFSFSDQLFGVMEPYIFTLTFALTYPVMFLLVSLLKSPELLRSWFTADALVVSLLFSFGEPIFVFSVYFGCWHAFNHTKTMLNYLNKFGMNVSFKWFYKNTFLYSVLSYAGLIVLYFALQAFGNADLLVALLFILISVLTLPHMFVVEKMYGNFNPE
ncbi:Brp/Blh family beta-carotene 15,15'-dioxygenase [Gracilimonas halophila]|uniref:Probable beta-carotene 15,15'-dioxygenase n=1 Tax=Gracilimonas halophila TaxID=1834464 RepID=A0ABW5JJ77_9BACT